MWIGNLEKSEWKKKWNYWKYRLLAKDIVELKLDDNRNY